MVNVGPLGPVDPWTGKSPCPVRHRDAVEVRTVLDGELVAWWCEDCESRLPAEWQPPQGQYGELLHTLGIGMHAPIVAVLNRLTGEFVPLDPPLYAPLAGVDRTVAEQQRRIEAKWAAEHPDAACTLLEDR